MWEKMFGQLIQAAGLDPAEIKKTIDILVADFKAFNEKLDIIVEQTKNLPATLDELRPVVQTIADELAKEYGAAQGHDYAEPARKPASEPAPILEAPQAVLTPARRAPV